MLTSEHAEQIAAAWIAAWNRHDLDAILAHYAPDVEFRSPFIVKLLGEPEGLVRGAAALQSYFARALTAYPELRFNLHAVYAGVDSLVVVYQSVNGLQAAELMELNPAGQVQRVRAHYAPSE